MRAKLVRIVRIITFVVITFASQLNSQAKQIGDDSVKANSDEQKRNWLIVDYGYHAPEIASGNVEGGQYGKISLEIPFSPRVGLILYLDRWKDDFSHGGIGLGVNMIIFRKGKVDILSSPSLFVDVPNIGILIPIAVAYRILDNDLRFQISTSYRSEGEFSVEGNHSHSFFNYTVGVGLSLDKIFSTNNKYPTSK